MLMAVEGWAGLFVIVLAMAIYRRIVARHEDDTLHLLDNSGVVTTQQASLNLRLTRIDIAGKVLTVALVAYALAIAGMLIHQVWLQGLQIHE